MEKMSNTDREPDEIVDYFESAIVNLQKISNEFLHNCTDQDQYHEDNSEITKKIVEAQEQICLLVSEATSGDSHVTLRELFILLGEI